MDPKFAPVKTGAVEDSNGSLDWYSVARRPKCIKTTTQFFEAQLDLKKDILFVFVDGLSS